MIGFCLILPKIIRKEMQKNKKKHGIGRIPPFQFEGNRFVFNFLIEKS